MPRMRMSEDQKKMSFEIDQQHYQDPAEATNWDAANMPTKRTDYEITKEYFPPLVPITPLEVPPKGIYDPLAIQDYVVPTRQELDILEVLWLKEDVMDTTLYSCLDTTLSITMEDLNRLLEKMNRKKIVSRYQVSPRFEFNAFGVMIEMSPTNRRNKVYAYQSNVDRDLMKKFIDANAYLFKEDSSIVNQKQLKAARKDNMLLKELNTKIHTPKK